MSDPQNVPANVLAAPVAVPPPKMRECLNCPAVFEVGAGHSARQLYCSDKCRNAAGNRDAAQGKTVMTLLKAWRLSRNSKARRAIGGQCLDEISRIVDRMIDLDRDDGRSSDKLFRAAEARLAMGQYMDRERIKRTR